MLNALYGTKKGMTSAYDARGRRVGATIVSVSPNFVTQIKTPDTKDGYMAIQLGTGTKKSVKKPQIGHGKKANVETPVRFFREVRVDTVENITPGKPINLGDIFAVGDSVKVTGVSKGKGFQGGVRRHGFHGGPKTHGQSDRHRAPGSIGSGTTPGRVYRGKSMAGHMGSEGVSTKNLEVIAVNKKDNLILIKGAVPGPNEGLIRITKLGRIKGYIAPPEEKIDEEEEGSEKPEEQKAGEPVQPENTDNASQEAPEEQKAETPVEQPVEEGKENA